MAAPRGYSSGLHDGVNALIEAKDVGAVREEVKKHGPDILCHPSILVRAAVHAHTPTGRYIFDYVLDETGKFSNSIDTDTVLTMARILVETGTIELLGRFFGVYGILQPDAREIDQRAADGLFESALQRAERQPDALVFLTYLEEVTRKTILRQERLDQSLDRVLLYSRPAERPSDDVLNSYVRLVRYLLSKGADPKATVSTATRGPRYIVAYHFHEAHPRVYKTLFDSAPSPIPETVWADLPGSSPRKDYETVLMFAIEGYLIRESPDRFDLVFSILRHYLAAIPPDLPGEGDRIVSVLVDHCIHLHLRGFSGNPLHAVEKARMCQMTLRLLDYSRMGLDYDKNGSRHKLSSIAHRESSDLLLEKRIRTAMLARMSPEVVVALIRHEGVDVRKIAPGVINDLAGWYRYFGENRTLRIRYMELLRDLGADVQRPSGRDFGLSEQVLWDDWERKQGLLSLADAAERAQRQLSSGQVWGVNPSVSDPRAVLWVTSAYLGRPPGRTVRSAADVAQSRRLEDARRQDALRGNGAPRDAAEYEEQKER